MTSTSGERSPDPVDTSAAIAFLIQDLADHDSTSAALAARQPGLAGHAAVETFSVLTRLPSRSRLVPAAANRLLGTSSPHSRHLSRRRAAGMLVTMAEHGIAGSWVGELGL